MNHTQGHPLPTSRLKREDRVVLAFVILSIGVVALLIFMTRAGDTSMWPRVDGVITGFRVQAKAPASAGRAGRNTPLTFGSEFKVEYRVDGQTFSVWAETPCVSNDPHWLEHKMHDLQSVSKAVVRYNPSNPGQAFGSIAGDTC